MVKEKTEILVKNTAFNKSDSDYNALLFQLRDEEVFFNLITSVDERGIQQAVVPAVTVGDGLRAIVFYTSTENPDLQTEFGGLPWLKAIEMALAIPDANGIVIQNNAGDWAALSREKLETLMTVYQQAAQ